MPFTPAPVQGLADIEILRTPSAWEIRPLTDRARDLFGVLTRRHPGGPDARLANAVALKAREVGLRTRFHGLTGAVLDL